MEHLREVLDGESYKQLEGIRCRLPGCKMFVAGGEEMLKMHLKSIHTVRCSARNDIPIACGDCNSVFYFYASFRRHLIKIHNDLPGEVRLQNCSAEAHSENQGLDKLSTAEANEQCSPSQLDAFPGNGGSNDDIIGDIVNPLYFGDPVGLEEMKDRAVNAITALRCDVSLPETKLVGIMDMASNLLDSYQRFALSKLKQFAELKGIDEHDEDFVDLVNSLELKDLFHDVRTPNHNLSYLAFKSDGSVPTVQEVVLGKRTVTKMVPHRSSHSQFGQVTMVRNVRVVKEVTHYIPIAKVLELVMRNPDARTSVLDEKENSELISGFKDGSMFKSQAIFNDYPNILRILLHVDEVEFLNPLGSRKGKKKLTIVSMKIQNFDPIINSSLDRVYFILAVQSSFLKKYGYAEVLKPMINDLRALETGIDLYMGGSIYRLQAVLVNVIGDTAALHDIFNIMGPQSKLFCRVCYIPRDKFRAGHFGDFLPHRTPESVESDLCSIRNSNMAPNQCGLIEECCLNTVGYFNYAKDRFMDAMHDLCEGVNMMVMKLILRNLVTVRKILTVSTINQNIEDFNYGSCEVENRPSANFSLCILKSRTNSIPQSASQCWLLLRAFPYLFHEFISIDPNYVQIIGVLLKINYFAFSNKYCLDDIHEFEVAIDKFQHLFKLCFPETNPINKIHHLSHYPELVRTNGPLTNCFAFEAKYKISKSQGKTCNNFKNLTYSITKRMNLKQTDSIIKHNYATKVHTVIKSEEINKTVLRFSMLLFDFPPTITTISNLNIDSTTFTPGMVAKFKICNISQYGIVEAIISCEEKILFIMLKLEICRIDQNMYSLEVKHNNELVRVSSLQVCTRKTYNLWKRVGKDETFSYISLKYYDG